MPKWTKQLYSACCLKNQIVFKKGQGFYNLRYSYTVEPAPKTNQECDMWIRITSSVALKTPPEIRVMEE